MDGMGVETKRLSVAVVCMARASEKANTVIHTGRRTVCGEGVLHVFQGSTIIDCRGTIGHVAVCNINVTASRRGNEATDSQGSIRCGPVAPWLSNMAYMGNSQKPGIFG